MLIRERSLVVTSILVCFSHKATVWSQKTWNIVHESHFMTVFLFLCFLQIFIQHSVLLHGQKQL